MDPTCGPWGSLLRPILPLDLGLFSVPPPLDLGGPPPPSFFPLLYQGAVHVFDSRHPTGSCEECPASWLPFQGSCYLFSIERATWEESQRQCAGAGAHLVIVGDLEEQVRSPQQSQAGGGRRNSPEGTWRGRGARPAQLAGSPFPAGLPESEHPRPRLLAGPEGGAPRAQDPGLPVGRRSPAQLQVREGTWGEGQVSTCGKCFGQISGTRLGWAGQTPGPG